MSLDSECPALRDGDAALELALRVVLSVYRLGARRAKGIGLFLLSLDSNRSRAADFSSRLTSEA